MGFVVSYLSHGSPGSFVRIYEICKTLNRLGIHSTILTPFEEELGNIQDTSLMIIPTSFSKVGLSSSVYRLASKLMTSKIGARILFSNLPFNRITKTLSSGLSDVLKKKTFDIIHAVQPHSAVACSTLCQQYHIPLVTDLHNIIEEELVAEGSARRGDDRCKWFHSIEQMILTTSSAVTVVSQQMKSYILENYTVPEDNIVVIPPAGPLLNLGQNITREQNVIYAGSVHPREHVDLFAKSIEYVRSQASFFISSRVMGNVNVKKIIDGSKANIRYVWFRRREEILGLLSRSKIGILTSRDDISRQIGPPLKLYDYLSCGLPIVANDVGGWSKLISNERVGILTEDNPVAYASGIDTLLEDEKLWQQMHMNALRLIRDKYNWDKIVTNNLIPLYKSLTKD